MVFLMYFNCKYLVFYLDFQRNICIFAARKKRKQIKILKNYGKT